LRADGVDRRRPVAGLTHRMNPGGVRIPARRLTVVVERTTEHQNGKSQEGQDGHAPEHEQHAPERSASAHRSRHAATMHRI
jgi:hypothetical protein